MGPCSLSDLPGAELKSKLCSPRPDSRQCLERSLRPNSDATFPTHVLCFLCYL